MTRLDTCGCGARTVLLRTAAGHPIAINADPHGHPIPHPEGNLVKFGNHQPPILRFALPTDPPPRYRAHTADCAISSHRSLR